MFRIQPIFQNEDAISAFFDSAIQTFLVRHGFLSSDVQPAPQKRRRVITGEEPFGDKPDVGNPRQTSGMASASNTHGTMTSIRERADIPSLYVNLVSESMFSNVFSPYLIPFRVVRMTKMEL